MNVNMRQQWTITGEALPTVRRRCPKCGQKTEFINSGKFRVNGNGRLLDIWLIYRCHQCKSTWNMTIYERISPEDIRREEYEGYLNNSPVLARVCGTSRELFAKNGAEVSEASGGYSVETSETGTVCARGGETEIAINITSSIRLRADALFAQQLKLTRNQVKKLFDQKWILCDGRPVAAGSRVKDGQLFTIIPEGESGSYSL